MNKYIMNSDGSFYAEPDSMTWAKWMEFADRKIANSYVGDVNISTVFLGIDHSFSGTEPVLFETMVFGGDLDQEQYRYETFGQAIKGHDEMVKRVKEVSNG